MTCLEQRSVRRASEGQLSQEDASRRLELSVMDTVCEAPTQAQQQGLV